MGAEGKHIEETVADQILLRCHLCIVNKEKDSHHIDFKWNTTQFPLHISFMNLVDT